MRQRFEQSVRLEMRIGEINRRIAQRIVEKLPEDPADAIQAVLRHRMTPKTYPDLPVCEGYVRHLLAIGVLTADQRAKLETSWTDHERVLAKVNEEMARLEVEWNERLWLQRSMDGQTDYAEEMRRLRAERWDLHQAYLQTILRDFEAAMPDNLKAVIRGSINDIDVLEFRGKNDAYPMR